MGRPSPAPMPSVPSLPALRPMTPATSRHGARSCSSTAVAGAPEASTCTRRRAPIWRFGCSVEWSRSSTVCPPSAGSPWRSRNVMRWRGVYAANGRRHPRPAPTASPCSATAPAAISWPPSRSWPATAASSCRRRRCCCIRWSATTTIPRPAHSNRCGPTAPTTSSPHRTWPTTSTCTVRPWPT